MKMEDESSHKYRQNKVLRMLLEGGMEFALR
jgi:hypothetical protein